MMRMGEVFLDFSVTLWRKILPNRLVLTSIFCNLTRLFNPVRTAPH